LLILVFVPSERHHRGITSAGNVSGDVGRERLAARDRRRVDRDEWNEAHGGAPNDGKRRGQSGGSRRTAVWLAVVVRLEWKFLVRSLQKRHRLLGVITRRRSRNGWKSCIAGVVDQLGGDVISRLVKQCPIVAEGG